MKKKIAFVFVFLVCLFAGFAVSASADSSMAIWPQQAAVTNASGKLVQLQTTADAAAVKFRPLEIPWPRLWPIKF